MLVVCGHFIGRDFLYLPKKDFFFILSSCDVEIKITIFNKMQIKKKIVWKMKYQSINWPSMHPKHAESYSEF